MDSVNNDVIEIDLKDLLAYCLQHIFVIFVGTILIGGLIAGGGIYSSIYK